MRRERSPEEVRRLKEQGIFDVGTSYLPIHGRSKVPKHKFWDGWAPPEERKARKK